MQTFEIHITGDERIVQAANQRDIKNITIHLLKPNKEVLRTEFMTSFIVKKENYQECKEYVVELARELSQHSDIIRVKIESPIYDEYVKDSLYIESHFEAKDDRFPMSRNIRKETILATDRAYDNYDEFIKNNKGRDLELCLYDTFVQEDADWFSLYEGMKNGR